MEILFVLATSDLQIRYGRGGVRAFKWILEPYAAMGVYLVLVVAVFDTGGEAAGLSLACAIVPFQLVMGTFSAGLQAVTLRGNILVNMAFPRALLPLSALATESVAFAATMTMIPLMMVVYWVGPTIAILWLPVVIAVTAAFAASLAYPAALFGVWYPEFQLFAGSAVRMLFFLAPGLIALDQITGIARDVMPYNPFTGLFEGFRDALLYGHAPAAWELLVPLGAAAALLAISLPLYRREQPHLAKLAG
jgi:lipopolysaccharide transport system permease protein